MTISGPLKSARQRLKVAGMSAEIDGLADVVEVDGVVDVGRHRLVVGRLEVDDGTSGSIVPAGLRIFGFPLPGFQPTVPSFMWKRRLKAIELSRPRAVKERDAVQVAIRPGARPRRSWPGSDAR